MGQKTNPKAFRLVTTQKHLAEWYGTKTNYSNLSLEDFFIRETLEKKLDDFLSLSSISISRSSNFRQSQDEIFIEINALYPRFKDMYKKAIVDFLEKENNENLLKILKSDRKKTKKIIHYVIKKKTRELLRILTLKIKKKIVINISFIRNVFENASLTTKFIGSQIKKRVPFRRVIKQTLKKVQLTSVRGIKIEISGRLNGIDIARSEWKRQGKVPLHTLNSIVQYSFHKVNTVYGIIGIKVWLYFK